MADVPTHTSPRRCNPNTPTPLQLEHTTSPRCNPNTCPRRCKPYRYPEDKPSEVASRFAAVHGLPVGSKTVAL